MAEGGEGANQVLAVQPAGIHHSASTGGSGQTALDYRTRLSRTQTGTWSGPFRRTRLARLPSPCHARHRSLWLPGAGAVPFPPSARFAANPGSGPPPSLTPCARQLCAPRLCRCEPNGIIPPRSPPCAARLQPTWHAPCPDVPVACETSYNTVVLGAAVLYPQANAIREWLRSSDLMVRLPHQKYPRFPRSRYKRYPSGLCYPHTSSGCRSTSSAFDTKSCRQ